MKHTKKKFSFNHFFLVDSKNKKKFSLILRMSSYPQYHQRLRLTFVSKSESFYCLLLFRSLFRYVLYFLSLFFSVRCCLFLAPQPIWLPIVLRPRNRNSICVRASIVHSLDFFSFFSGKSFRPIFSPTTENTAYILDFFLCLPSKKRFFLSVPLYIYMM